MEEKQMGTAQGARDEADRLAGSVMKEIDSDTRTQQEAEHRLQARKKAAGPRKRISLAVMFVLFAALTALNIVGYGPFGFSPSLLSGVDLRTAMSSEVDDLVDQLEAYHEDFGAYPLTLAEVGVDDASWEYEIFSPDRCRVTLNENQEVVTAELAEAGQ